MKVLPAPRDAVQEQQRAVPPLGPAAKLSRTGPDSKRCSVNIGVSLFDSLRVGADVRHFSTRCRRFTSAEHGQRRSPTSCYAVLSRGRGRRLFLPYPVATAFRTTPPADGESRSMDSQKVRIVELLAVRSPLPLRGVCEMLQARFGLPDFAFAAEAEGEWAISEAAGIAYCVSRPFQPIVWPASETRPGADCNVCVALMIEEEDAPGVDRERVLKERTPQVAQGIGRRTGRAGDSSPHLAA